jgi:hypothetical protein
MQTPEPAQRPSKNRGRLLRRTLQLFVIVGLPLLIPLLLPKKIAARRTTERETSTVGGAKKALVARERQVQDLVDAIKMRLSIPETIVASVVAENRLVVSVARSKDRDGAFSLVLEAAFLDLLTEEELEAVVAHELGHVWIFTHHPYLQTEELANRIAMRVAGRETLEAVYQKVWERMGRKSEVVYLPPAE